MVETLGKLVPRLSINSGWNKISQRIPTPELEKSSVYTRRSVYPNRKASNNKGGREHSETCNFQVGEETAPEKYQFHEYGTR